MNNTLLCASHLGIQCGAFWEFGHSPCLDLRNALVVQRAAMEDRIGVASLLVPSSSKTVQYGTRFAAVRFTAISWQPLVILNPRILEPLSSMAAFVKGV